MPLPEDLKSVMLVAIFGLLLLFALYFTKAIVMPIVFAFVLFLMLQPGMRLLARLHVPKVLGALIIVFMLFGAIGTLGYTLIGPATSWIAKRLTACRALRAGCHPSKNLSLTCNKPPAKWRRWRLVRHQTSAR